jgi:hypothetical protein
MVFLDLSKINDHKVTSFETNGYGTQTIHTEGGVVHRDDGPAMSTGDWAQEWYVNGVCHREDGPARLFKTHPNHPGIPNIAEWHLNGQFQTNASLDDETFNKHWHKGDK